MHKFSETPPSFKASARPNMRRNCRAAIAVAAAFFSTACWAGRPLATEDAGLLEKGECEFESFAGRQARSKVSFGSAQVGCGIGFNTQLALGTSREVASGSNENYFTVSGKTAVQKLTDDQAGFVIAYTLLNGPEESDYMKYVSAELKAVFTVPYEDWLFHGNAGLLHVHPLRDDLVIWGLAAERRGAIGPFDLMCEIYGKSKSSPWVQVATRWTAIPDQLYFDVSLGVQTNGAHTRLATIGMKLAF